MHRNFILTDVMKTGPHQHLESFINLHSLPDQQFDMTGEYYTLHEYDLDSYDRRFAIIDRRSDNRRIKDNAEFHVELRRRCELLHSQGFVFIKATPWESSENIQPPNEPWPHLEIEHTEWLGGVSWFWFYMYQKHKDRKFSFDHSEKTHDFLYLNKQPRPDRKKFYDIASSGDLLENSIYTFWPDRKLPKQYELPWVETYPLTGMDQDIFEKPYNDTKYSLISETNTNNSDVFITEKMWKTIIAEHPFIVFGNHLYLQKLRELGFKTFSTQFDESYDLERNVDERITKIIDTCQSLKKTNWRDLYLQTQSLRRHNLKTFFDRDKLSLQINAVIKSFFEFADSR